MKTQNAKQETPKASQQDDHVVKLVKAIKAAKTKIDEKEGQVVKAMLALAGHLAALRKEAGEKWQDLLKEIGLHARVAARYEQLAQSWLSESGLNESALLGRLPMDLLKLEWVARLNRKALEELSTKHDLKGLPRAKVIQLAQEALGRPAKQRKPKPLTAELQKVFRRLRKVLQTAQAEAGAAADQAGLREIIAAGRDELDQALQALPDAG
jgi:hypothetical protein